MQPETIQSLRAGKLGRKIDVKPEATYTQVRSLREDGETRLFITYKQIDDQGNEQVRATPIGDADRYNFYKGRVANKEIADLRVHFLTDGVRIP